ncbi:hypothetical protein [Mycoplasmopsis adleri]|uniref:hypothetical protein n=1 Tax=Mycoplasmopsis adleri TaxID=51362 RepID=UPI0038737D01
MINKNDVIYDVSEAVSKFNKDIENLSYCIKCKIELKSPDESNSNKYKSITAYDINNPDYQLKVSVQQAKYWKFERLFKEKNIDIKDHDKFIFRICGKFRLGNSNNRFIF